MKQYVFKRQHTQSTNITATAIDAISVPVMDSQESSTMSLKQIIMSEYDKYTALATTNVESKRLYDRIQELSSIITGYVGRLQNLEKGQEAERINSTLIDLNGQYNMVKEEFDIHVRRELVYSRSNYPDLFEMIIDGVDRTTLEDALTKFELYKQGKITAEMAVRNGVSLTRTQYKVPNDFFNEEAIRDYYKDL